MKKTMVKTSDYELYRILLPWRSLLSRQRSFIVRELEKLHPRFSGSCCYDTKYCVEKKKLLAEVVVMEKASLAEYRQRGGVLFLEGERKRSVFSSHARTVQLLTFALIVLAGIFSFRIVRSFFASSDYGSSADFARIERDAETVCASEEELNKAEGELEETLSSVFASVSAHGGKISSFSYVEGLPFSLGSDKTQCSFSIYGCDCEDIAYAQYSVVSFKNNEPHFNLMIPFTQSAGMRPSVQKAEEGQLSLRDVRSQMVKLGAVFESERSDKKEAAFAFRTARSRLYSCLRVAGEAAVESSWAVTQLSVSENNGVCAVSVSFSRLGNRHFNPLLLVAQYAYLFGSELKLKPAGDRLFSLPPAQSVKSLVAKNKIGEITKDGSVFVCFRGTDGRMNFQEKELVNETN